MTVSTTLNKQFFTGNGVTTSFTFTYRLLVAAHMVVYVNEVLIDPGLYSVTINTNGVGGEVVFDTAPANDLQVLLYRRVSYTQESALPNESDFQQVTLEDMVDKLTMECQQLQEQLDRAAIGSLFVEGGAQVQLPPPASRRALLWHPDEDGRLINSTYDPDETFNSVASSLSIMAGYLSDAEAAAAAALAAEAAAQEIADALPDVGDAAAYYSFGYVENTTGTTYAASSDFNISAVGRASLGTIDITFGGAGGGAPIPATAPVLITAHPLQGSARPIATKLATTVDDDDIMTAMRITFFAEDSGGQNWALIDPPAFSFCMPKLGGGGAATGATGPAGADWSSATGAVGDILVFQEFAPSIFGYSRTPIGDEGEILQVSGGLPTWGNAAAEGVLVSGIVSGGGSVDSVSAGVSVTSEYLGAGNYRLTFPDILRSSVIAATVSGPFVIPDGFGTAWPAGAEVSISEDAGALVLNVQVSYLHFTSGMGLSTNVVPADGIFTFVVTT